MVDVGSDRCWVIMQAASGGTRNTPASRNGSSTMLAHRRMLKAVPHHTRKHKDRRDNESIGVQKL